MKMVFLCFSLLNSILVFATVDSPVVQGLAGAGRSGIPREAIFSNPAATALANKSSSFLYFTKPRIPEMNAGGRSYSVGAIDGENPALKGAMAFTRSSRARLQGSSQTYEDRSEIRIAAGHQVWGDMVAGVGGRYVTRRISGQEKKFFQGDVGLIWGLFNDLKLGLTYENFTERAGEMPPTLGAGLNYTLGYGAQVYGDLSRSLAGTSKNENSYAAGVELALAGDFAVRGGKFLDRYRDLKGWTLGLSWVGPRFSVDYAMRTSGDVPHERDHIFGINFLL